MRAFFLLAVAASAQDPLPPDASARFGSRRFSHDRNVLAVGFSPDGKILATAGGSVRLWEAETGRLIRELPEDGWAGHWLAFSADGSSLMSATAGTRDTAGAISLWDPKDGTLKRRFDEAWIDYRAAFSRDGRTAAFGSSSFAVRVWDLDAPRERCSIPSRARPYAFAISPDSSVLATERDDEIVCWDARTGRELKILCGHVGEAGSRVGQIHALAFSPDGKSLASSGRDRTVRLWDVAGGVERTRLELTDGANGIAFSPDGKSIAFGNFRGVQVWTVGSPEKPLRLEGYRGDGFSNAFDLCFSPDGRTVAAACRDSRVRLWDAASGRRLHTGLGHDQPVSSVAFSPDGARLASGSKDGTVRIWNVRAAEQVRVLSDPEAEGILSLAWSPDGRRVACGTDRGHTRLWDVASGEARRFGNGDGYWIHSVAISPDGKLLAAGARNHVVELWDLSSGKSLAPLDGLRTHPDPGGMRKEGHRAIVTFLAFSSDGRRLLSSSADQTSIVWEIPAGTERCRFVSKGSPARFSRDGRRLVAGDSDDRCVVFDTDTGKPVRDFGPETWPCALGPGLRVSATRPSYDVLEIRELASATRIRTFRVPPFGPVAVAPGGDSIVTGMEDGTLLFWPVLLQGSPSAKDQAVLWAELADPEAGRAWTTMGEAVRRSDETVQALREKLLQGLRTKEQRETAIRELEADDPDVRNRAAASLDGVEAGAELRRALAGTPSSEAMARLEGLLRTLEQAGEPKVEAAATIRLIRAVQVLERIGTPSARESLRELAEGAPRVRVRIEARGALERLAR